MRDLYDMQNPFKKHKYACLFHINVPIQHMKAISLHVGTDRSLLPGHDALLIQQIARDLLHALSSVFAGCRLPDILRYFFTLSDHQVSV